MKPLLLPSLCILFTLLLMACPSSLLFADDIIVIEKTEINSLNIDLGKSVVLKSKVAIRRISVADPEVVEYLTLSTREIYLTAKKPGTTRLTLWVKGGMLSYDLEVTHDISTLKQKIRENLPEEDGIRVDSMGNTIMLSGRVSSTAALSQVLTIAYSFVAEEGNVQNLLKVNSSQQVMLEVRIAEMSKQLVRELGANFGFARRSGDFAIGVLSDFGGVSDLGGIGTAAAVLQRGKSTWTGVIDALEVEGLVKILAEPTLVALSGQNASFLAGGEFPIPSDAGLGSTDIEWKPFGVSLAFKPIVLSKDRINIHVQPEVSELDYDRGITTEDGLIIPGVNTRKLSTMVELGDGQSFALAGLMKNTMRDTLKKYPFLGDIPIIGLLFRSKQFQREETELVIIVTPHLVKPLESSQQPLPTDSYHEPDDIDFYLWGLSESRKKLAKPVKMSESLDGEFGHAIP